MLLQVSQRPEKDCLNCSNMALLFRSTRSSLFDSIPVFLNSHSIATTAAITPAITPTIGSNAVLKKAAIPPAVANIELKAPNDITNIPIVVIIGPNTDSNPSYNANNNHDSRRKPGISFNPT